MNDKLFTGLLFAAFSGLWIPGIEPVEVTLLLLLLGVIGTFADKLRS